MIEGGAPIPSGFEGSEAIDGTKYVTEMLDPDGWLRAKMNELEGLERQAWANARNCWIR